MNQSGDLRVDQIMPRKLCKSWINIDFEECLIDKGSYTKIKKSDMQVNGSIPVIDQGENFISGYIEDLNSIYQGDLPVIIFGDHTRRFKFINFKFAVGADGTKILCPFDALHPKFFYYYLKSLNIESQGYSRHYRFLKQIQVPIAPLNEQKRIVAKLEKLLAKVNESCDRLSRIPTILKRFRQSVLASACSGRLTADWRKLHPDIEPAEELLKRIQEERIKRYQEECTKAKAEGRRKPKGLSYNEGIKYDTEPLENFTLPNNWTLCACSEISDLITDGEHKTPKRIAKAVTADDRDGVLLLSARNVHNGYLDLSKVDYIPEEEYQRIIKRCYPQENDILVSCSGSVGRVCRIKNNNTKFTLVRSAALIKFQYNPYISEYIEIILQSHLCQEQISQLQKATAQANLFIGQISKIIIPLPPLEEQKEIVRRVEALFRKCALIEQRYLKAKAYTDKLTQSILAKAFRGELVPQDPNDEPAELLLERIREEKALTEKSKKTKKKSTRKRKTT